MKVAVLSFLLALAAVPTASAADAPSDCAKSYTRAHFHQAARSTFATAFPPAAKKATLHRVVRCQRRAESRPIVRKHRKLYRSAWAARFYFVRAWARVEPWLKAALDRIAFCETGGTMNPAILSPGGKYRGLFQFDFTTWAGVGGRGDPAAAPALEQKVRAAILYRRHGSAPWPVCGR